MQVRARFFRKRSNKREFWWVGGWFGQISQPSPWETHQNKAKISQPLNLHQKHSKLPSQSRMHLPHCNCRSNNTYTRIENQYEEFLQHGLDSTLLGVLKVIFHPCNLHRNLAICAVVWIFSNSAQLWTQFFTNISTTLHNVEYSVDLHTSATFDNFHKHFRNFAQFWALRWSAYFRNFARFSQTFPQLCTIMSTPLICTFPQTLHNLHNCHKHFRNSAQFWALRWSAWFRNFAQFSQTLWICLANKQVENLSKRLG